MRTSILFFAFFLTGCPSVVTARYATCYLEPQPSPSAAAPGDEVILSGGPLTSIDDTVVRVGGLPATVLSVDRVACEACDRCLEEARCDACGRCPDCNTACIPCTQSTTILVPELPPGQASILLYNSQTVSAAVPFTVLDAPDATDTAP